MSREELKKEILFILKNDKSFSLDFGNLELFDEKELTLILNYLKTKNINFVNSLINFQEEKYFYTKQDLNILNIKNILSQEKIESNKELEEIEKNFNF